MSIRDTPRSAARLTPRGEAVVAQLLAVRAVARLALDVAAVVGAFLALAALAILLAP